MDIAHIPLSPTPSVEPAGLPSTAGDGPGPDGRAGPFAELMEGIMLGLPPRQDLAASATTVAGRLPAGLGRSDLQELAVAGAAEAPAAPLLQAVTLGPALRLIIPVSAPPDSSSLADFARAQGLDERAVEWLLARPEATAAEAQALAAGMALTAAHPLQPVASPAQAIPAPAWAALAAPSTVTEPWAGAMSSGSARPGAGLSSEAVAPALPTARDWVAARQTASDLAIPAASASGRPAGGAPATVSPALSQGPAPPAVSSGAGMGMGLAAPHTGEQPPLPNLLATATGSAPDAQLPGGRALKMALAASALADLSPAAAAAPLPGQPTQPAQAAAAATTAMLPPARAAESWAWLATMAAPAGTTEDAPAATNASPSPVSGELSSLLPKVGRAPGTRGPGSAPESTASPSRPAAQRSPVEWDLDLGAELPELSDTLREWLAGADEAAGPASGSEVTGESSAARPASVESASGRGAAAASSTGTALERPPSGEAAQARADQYQALAQKVGEALAQRLLAQMERGHWNVRLNVRPQQLGEVQIELQMRSGELEAAFRTSAPMTRDLIQDSLPRLREVLSQLGMDVAQFHVSAGPGQRHGGNPTPRQAPADRSTDGSVPVEAAAKPVPRETRGGIEGWDVLV